MAAVDLSAVDLSASNSKTTDESVKQSKSPSSAGGKANTKRQGGQKKAQAETRNVVSVEAVSTPQDSVASVASAVETSTDVSAIVAAEVNTPAPVTAVAKPIASSTADDASKTTSGAVETNLELNAGRMIALNCVSYRCDKSKP